MPPSQLWQLFIIKSCIIFIELPHCLYIIVGLNRSYCDPEVLTHEAILFYSLTFPSLYPLQYLITTNMKDRIHRMITAMSTMLANTSNEMFVAVMKKCNSGSLHSAFKPLSSLNTSLLQEMKSKSMKFNKRSTMPL